MMMGTGGALTSSGGLDALANLAAVLADPKQLSAAIAQLKEREAAALAAEVKAQAVIDSSVKAKAEADTAAALVAADKIKIAEGVRANEIRTGQLNALATDLDSREQALTKAKAEIEKGVADADVKATARDAAYNAKLTSDTGVLNTRATRLDAWEKALTERRTAMDELEGKLKQRAELFAAAARGL